jgi:O-antigen ligase
MATSEERKRPNGKGAGLVSALAGKSGRYLLMYAGALLLAVVVGAAVAYSERYGGDKGPYLVLGAFLVIAAAVAIMVQWRLGALLLVAAPPFESMITLGPVTSGMKALGFLTLVSLALALLTDEKLFERFKRLWQQPLTPAVGAFVLWVAASILWAADKGSVISATVTFLGVFGLMIIVGLLEKRWLVLAWAGFVFSAALSVPAGYILPVPEGTDWSGSGRFMPGGAGPNTYACVLAIALFVAYFWLLRRHAIIAILLSPVFLYGIFATESRTGLIALVATPLLALFVPRLAARLGWRVLPMYVLGAVALVVIILAFPAVGGSAAERYMTLSDPANEETWNGRWSLWQGAFEVIASNPILGVGAGNFAEAAMEHSELVVAHTARKDEVAGVAHNMLLGIAAQLGLVGLILFLAILFFVFTTAVPIARRSGMGTGIFLGLIVFMFAGLTLSWESHKIVYVLFGSILALQLHDSARRAPSLDKPEGPY